MSQFSVSLLDTKREILYFLTVIFIIFSLSLGVEFYHFKQLTSHKFQPLKVKVTNQYTKQSKNNKPYDVLVCQGDYGKFYTTIWGEIVDLKLRYISLKIITENISFYDYLKGYFAPSFDHKVSDEYDTRYELLKKIEGQHDFHEASQIYGALFFATPLDNSTRNIFNNLGIAHLIAISGFHLGLLSGILLFILNPIYKFFQQRYFPYRNRYYDLAFVTLVVLFGYLYLVDFVPSLLRAYVMLAIGALFLYRSVDILSFKSLFIAVMLIIAFYPRILFSVGFLLSVSGVFFIYLYLHYFNSLNKYLSFVFFNIYIYLAMLPIVHYFFPIVSYYQLLSPLLTVGFVVFYPLSIILHLVGYGGVFDRVFATLHETNFGEYLYTTPLYLLIPYLLSALLAIRYKSGFYILNGVIFFVFYSIFIASLV